MNWTRFKWTFWDDIFRRVRVERDLDEEIRAHIAIEVQQRIERGESPEHARTAALRELGGVDAVKEAARDTRTWQAAERWMQDVRFALRQLRKSPGLAMAAILILAVGIGATSAVFSVVNTVVLRPLAYREAGRLVAIDEGTPAGRLPVNAMHFNEMRVSAHSFEAMALIGGITMNLTGSGEPERLLAARVSPVLFPMLGIQPALGRLLRNEEDVPGRDHVVVIDNDLWRRRFGADPNIAGKTVTLDGNTYEIAGVLPAGFHFPTLAQLYPMTITGLRPQVWKPFALRPEETVPIGDFNFICIARLAPAVSIAQARAELDVLMIGIRNKLAPQMSQLGAGILPLQAQVISRSSAGLELLFAAVSVMLLGGCLNVTNLLLTRTSGRRREIAIRAAIGASRWRLTRQALAETLLLSAIGSVSSLVVAYGGIALILRVAPVDIPRLDEVRLDLQVFLFALGMSLAAGMLVGLVPALRFAKADLNQAITSSSRSATANRQTGRLRSALVGLEVALTVICLIAGGLLLRSFWNLTHVNRGFQTERVLTADLAFTENRYPGNDKKSDFIHAVIERLQGVPGVTSVGVINRIPLSGGGGNNTFIAEGISEHPIVDIRTVNPDYLRTMGIALYEGRGVDERDRNRNAAVISKSTADRVWPGQSPIGKRFRLGSPERPPIEVIGVAADIRGVSLDRDPQFTIYVPYWQGSFFFRAVTLTLKTQGEPSIVAADIRTAIRGIDAEMPLPPFRTMDDVVEQSIGQRRFQMNLILLFGMIAIVLAALGIYGTMSYAVAQRTNEVGIRIALGAQPRAIAAGVVSDALKTAAIGLAAGVPLALAAAAAMRSLLFGVTTRDPLTVLAACGVVLTSAALAAYLPARRASKVDPMVALREE